MKGYCLFILYEFAFGYVNLGFKILVELKKKNILD